ncbi:zinc-binding dehydrogenase [Corynebacterium lubricantis]|uniref:zinc-binding dehydrogenase n=1 Tax=Corynebacterium lubricantis TaxID=541095 RepID=UPI003CCBE3D4
MDEPTAGAGEVAINVQAAGLCHSDVGILEGVIPEPLLGSVPQTLGHEVAGIVSAVGEGVTKFKEGDRVAFHMGADGPGMGIPGGYARVCVAPEALVVPIPDEVPFTAAAAATDAGMTPYHAINTAGEVKAGDNIVIIGLGGLGFNGLQVALGLGANVWGVEPRESVHAKALEMGAKEVVTDISGFAGRDFDAAFDFAGFGTTTSDAVAVVRPGGRIVLVGVGRNETTISTPAFIQKEVTLRGSAGGSNEDLAGYLNLVAEGKVNPVTSTIKFEEIGEGLKQVEAGTVTGRLVADLSDHTN